jgi:hypothetical protein
VKTAQTKDIMPTGIFLKRVSNYRLHGNENTLDTQVRVDGCFIKGQQQAIGFLVEEK